MPGFDSSRFIVGRETDEAASRSRCSQRKRARAARISSLVRTAFGLDAGTLQIDKSVLVFPEPRRIRDRDHVRYVMKQPCLVCSRRPSDPHHLRFAQWRALGRKVSDEFTVPLCRTHHREIHRCGDEESWWQNKGLDPMAAARTLWLETHPLSTEGTLAGNEDRPCHRS
jgi:hypothetical protein